MNLHTRVNKTVAIISFVISILLILISHRKPSHRENFTLINHKLKDIEKRIQVIINENENLLRIISKLKNTRKLDEYILTKKDLSKIILPVVVLTCSRVSVGTYLKDLIKYRPGEELFLIIISHDCGKNDVYKAIKNFTKIHSSVSLILQPYPKATPSLYLRPEHKHNHLIGYYHQTRHHKAILNHVFKKLNYEAVIILEDDLKISSDIFEYFLGTYPLLLQDPTLWCVSAWNDNGKKECIDVDSPDLLHRTDFFPGRGWMIRRETWLQFEPNWPVAFFDDWLRIPKNVDSRSCIRPEISRTYSFGNDGVSNGLYYEQHEKPMLLNTYFIPFTKMNLSYLVKEEYDKNLESTVNTLPTLSIDELTNDANNDTFNVKVPYADQWSFRESVNILNLMGDIRHGVPRTAYLGIVTCVFRGRRIYITPDFHWTEYNSSWESCP